MVVNGVMGFGYGRRKGDSNEGWWLLSSDEEDLVDVAGKLGTFHSMDSRRNLASYEMYHSGQNHISSNYVIHIIHLTWKKNKDYHAPA